MAQQEQQNRLARGASTDELAKPWASFLDSKKVTFVGNKRSPGEGWQNMAVLMAEPRITKCTQVLPRGLEILHVRLLIKWISGGSLLAAPTAPMSRDIS